METVTSPDGTAIAHERSGTGPPIVMVHGSCASHESLAGVAAHLDGFETFVVDRRGRGASDDAVSPHPTAERRPSPEIPDRVRDEDYPYDLQRETEDVQAVIEAVDGEPVLFGHSYGGLCSLEAAQSTDVAGVVLYEPALLVEGHREGADGADRMAEHLEADDEQAAFSAAFAAMIDGLDVTELPDWPGVCAHAETLLRELYEVEAYRLPDAVEFDAPSLLLRSEEGPAHLRDGVGALAERVPSSRTVELDGVGHSGIDAAPDLVASAVAEFAHDVAAGVTTDDA